MRTRLVKVTQWRACVDCRTEGAAYPNTLCDACRAKRERLAADAAKHIKKKRDQRRQKDEE